MRAADLLARLKAEGITPSLKLRLDGNMEPAPETLELVRRHKGKLLCLLADAQNIPPLPWQIKALLRAANSGSLPQGIVRLENGLVPDLATYALAAAAWYLCGDRDEALRRLWHVYRAWQEPN